VSRGIALRQMELSGLYQPRLLYSRERVPGTHGIGGWVRLRNGLGGLETRRNLLLPGFELGTVQPIAYIQGGSNMTGTDLYVNKPHCAAAVRP